MESHSISPFFLEATMNAIDRGKTTRLARISRDMTQLALARATGLHEKTLYKSLSRKGNPNLRTLMGVAGAMGMRIALVPAEKHCDGCV